MATGRLGPHCFSLPPMVSEKIHQRDLEDGKLALIFLKVAGGLEAFVDPSFVPLKGLYPHFTFADRTEAEQWVANCRLKWDGNCLHIYPKRRFSIGAEIALPIEQSLPVEALKEKLQRTSRAVIVGLCGVGKLSLIRSYLNKWGSLFYSPQHQWKIHADHLHESFTDIAGVLGQNGAEGMREWLRTNGHWLMVVEGATDISLLSDYFPTQLGGHLIFVSSCHQGPGELQLDPLKADEAIELLQTTTQFEHHEKIEQLVEEVGFLPLTFVEIGDFLKRSITSYDQFYSSLNNQTNWEEITPQTWKKLTTHFTDLKRISADSFNLMCEIAFLGQSNIPKKLFLSDPKNIIHLDKLLIKLSDYFLIFPGQEADTISTYPIVQKILRQFIKGREQAVIEKVVQRFLSKWNFDEENLSNDFDQPDFVPHIRELCRQAVRCGFLQKGVANLYSSLGSYYEYYTFDFPAAYSCYSQAYKICTQAIQRQDQKELDLLVKGGRAAQRGGDLQKAAKAFNKILEKTSSPLAHSFLGSIALQALQFEKAESHYLEALHEEAPSSPLTKQRRALSLVGLAHIRLEQNKQVQGELLCQQSLPYLEELTQLGGTNQVAVGEIFTDLALFHWRTQEFSNVKQFCFKALSAFHQYRDKEGPHLAKTFFYLGSAAEELNQHEEAVLYLEKACQLYRCTDPQSWNLLLQAQSYLDRAKTNFFRHLEKKGQETVFSNFFSQFFPS